MGEEAADADAAAETAFAAFRVEEVEEGLAEDGGGGGGVGVGVVGGRAHILALTLRERERQLRAR